MTKPCYVHLWHPWTNNGTGYQWRWCGLCYHRESRVKR